MAFGRIADHSLDRHRHNSLHDLLGDMAVGADIRRLAPVERTNAIVTLRPLPETSPKHRDIMFYASENYQVAKYTGVKMGFVSRIMHREYDQTADLSIVRALQAGGGRYKHCFHCHFARER